MKTIEYKGVTYRPRQTWALIWVLQQEGRTIEIKCYPFTRKEDREFGVGETYDGWYVGVSPFIALGKLVAVIKEEENAK